MPRPLVLLIRAVLAVLVVALVVVAGRDLTRHAQAMLARVRTAALLKPLPPGMKHGQSLDDYLFHAVQRTWPTSWGLAKPLDHGPCEAGDTTMACVNMIATNGLMVQIRSADGVNWRGAACFPLAQAATALALQRLADAQEPPRRPQGLPDGFTVQRLLRAPGHPLAPDRDLIVLDGTPMTLMRRTDRPDGECLAVVVPEPLMKALFFAEAGLPLQPAAVDQAKSLDRLQHASVDGLAYAMPPLPGPTIVRTNTNNGAHDDDTLVVTINR